MGNGSLFLEGGDVLGLSNIKDAATSRDSGQPSARINGGQG